jgi:hypothetical protein
MHSRRLIHSLPAFTLFYSCLASPFHHNISILQKKMLHIMTFIQLPIIYNYAHTYYDILYFWHNKYFVGRENPISYDINKWTQMSNLKQLNDSIKLLHLCLKNVWCLFWAITYKSWSLKGVVWPIYTMRRKEWTNGQWGTHFKREFSHFCPRTSICRRPTHPTSLPRG